MKSAESLKTKEKNKGGNGGPPVLHPFTFPELPDVLDFSRFSFFQLFPNKTYKKNHSVRGIVNQNF